MRLSIFTTSGDVASKVSKERKCKFVIYGFCVSILLYSDIISGCLRTDNLKERIRSTLHVAEGAMNSNVMITALKWTSVYAKIYQWKKTGKFSVPEPVIACFYNGSKGYTLFVHWLQDFPTVNTVKIHNFKNDKESILNIDKMDTDFNQEHARYSVLFSATFHWRDQATIPEALKEHPEWCLISLGYGEGLESKAISLISY